MNDKIIELAKLYAKSYEDCFHSESTNKYISMFGYSRWNNTLTDVEISDEERNSNELKELFVNEFLRASKVIIDSKQVVVDKNGNKTKLVKRKKD